MDTVSARLGKNVLQLRRARGLSQAGLARLAEVPRSTISHIESGSGNPSLKNLSRIADALRVSLEEVVAHQRPEIALVKAADIPNEARGGGKLFKLLPDPIPGMAIDRMELAPGGRLPGMPHLTMTKEYLTCVEGEVLAHVGGDTWHLNKGDVLAFPGNLPHGYENPGQKPAVCISVVTHGAGLG